MVPRKHLQERGCMNMEHHIFLSMRFLIRAGSFMTEVIITHDGGQRLVFLCFSHSFGIDRGSRKWRKKCHLALQCTLYSNWDIWGSLLIDWILRYFQYSFPTVCLIKSIVTLIECFRTVWEVKGTKVQKALSTEIVESLHSLQSCPHDHSVHGPIVSAWGRWDDSLADIPRTSHSCPFGFWVSLLCDWSPEDMEHKVCTLFALLISLSQIFFSRVFWSLLSGTMANQPIHSPLPRIHYILILQAIFLSIQNTW